MLRLIRSVDPPPNCRLTCGQAIYSWFRHLPRPRLAPAGELLPLTGLPVVLDATMPRGTWRYTQDGVEVQSGAVGDGEHVWYLPAVKQFVTTESGPLREVLDGNLPEPEPVRMADPEVTARAAWYVTPIIHAPQPFGITGAGA